MGKILLFFKEKVTHSLLLLPKKDVLLEGSSHCVYENLGLKIHTCERPTDTIFTMCP